MNDKPKESTRTSKKAPNGNPSSRRGDFKIGSKGRGMPLLFLNGNRKEEVSLHGDREKLKNVILLLRPRHWIKNSFVFLGFFFAEQLTNFELLFQVFIAAIAFCLASSSVYIFNDIVDLERDKRHEKKKHRPLASGKISVFRAKLLSCLLAISGLFIGMLVSPMVSLMICSYLIINVLYSLRLKQIVILDVFCISLGFMLRIFAGTVGVGIPPSEWLLLCGMMLTLFLGFAKRRAEVMVLSGHNLGFRKVLSQYDSTFLDQLTSICAAGVIITYSLYTMSQVTVGIHHTNALIYTIPFVVYGVFRYLFLLHNDSQGEDPATEIMRDPHMMTAIAGWAITSITIMYFVY